MSIQRDDVRGTAALLGIVAVVAVVIAVANYAVGEPLRAGFAAAIAAALCLAAVGNATGYWAID